MATGRAFKRSLSIYRIVTIAVIMALVIKLFVADLILIRGVSMSPTIRSGTVAIVIRCAYGIRLPFWACYLGRWDEPQPGDVVLVTPTPGSPRQAVKRVFECGPAYMRAEAGILSARGGSVMIRPNASTRMAGQLYVPPGRVFVVGDNEEQSFDSRDYGPVPVEKIAGKVLLFRDAVNRSVKKTVYSKDAADDVDR
ncbi:MAG: signal peptidase I [Spirochaetia bacterium]|jgi:signal peptidase I|nr:signal peptidase I [Spirochaetia bacterium]